MLFASREGIDCLEGGTLMPGARVGPTQRLHGANALSLHACEAAMPCAGKPKVLIANRGEIAWRVARSCHELGLTPVVVYTEPDALSLHVLEAQEKVCLGSSTREYTNISKLLDAALSTG